MKCTFVITVLLCGLLACHSAPPAAKADTTAVTVAPVPAVLSVADSSQAALPATASYRYTVDVSDKPLPDDTGAIALEPLDSIPEGVDQHCVDMMAASLQELQHDTTRIARGEHITAIKVHGQVIFLKANDESETIFSGHGYTLKITVEHQTVAEEDEFRYDGVVVITRRKEKLQFHFWGAASC